MIDLHYHLLYGVDDGPADLETALSMARESAAEGVTEIVCTPHASNLYPYDAALVEARLAELRLHLAGVVELGLGCDFHLSAENIADALAHPLRYSINQGGYLLVEFPDLLILPSYEESIYRLQVAGYTPIITHPERCPALVRNPALLAAWIRKGCLVQITAGSLYGRFGPRAERFSNQMLKQHWVHFVASDAHHPQWRPPHLKRAYEHVAKRMGTECARRLFSENPRTAARGERLGKQPAPLGIEAGKTRRSPARGQMWEKPLPPSLVQRLRHIFTTASALGAQEE